MPQRRLEPPDTPDHGEKDLQLALPGGEAERRQLRVEDLGVGEAVAQTPQAERRVLAPGGPDPLLAAEVVSAHDDRVRGGRFEEPLVSRALRFDRRRRGRRGGVEEPGTEETDALRGAAFDGGEV